MPQNGLDWRSRRAFSDGETIKAIMSSRGPFSIFSH